MDAPADATAGTAPRRAGADDEGGRTSEDVTLAQEQLRVETETRPAGVVRARKEVDVDRVVTRVERGTEHADREREAVADPNADSGQVETLPDGSLSVPVFEEQLVVTKRLVVRERVVLRKHTVYEEHEVSADLKRERLEVETEGDVVVRDETDGSPT
jgi:uncharacterized protein (TIGR02271 family)